MNFHSLPRRDLQFLCKKNCIPANLTNVAMAKALEALETVEGIGETKEALGIRSPKVNSPELPHIGQKNFTRGVTHGDESKIQQQQEPTPMPRSHRVTVKTLEVTKMASNEEEIQENLGFQSLNVKSPELPRTARRTSARRAAHREKPSPLHRSCLKAPIDLEEEGEKKKVPQILPNTPATRKAARGVEAQSSRRMVKKNEDVERHTKTPKEVEAKGEKAIGVVTRRSTRLSSRKALEESVNTQSKSKGSSRENSAVKMEALAKEDAGEQEKEEVKKDLVKFGDSCAVIVEEHKKKDQEREIQEFSSSIEVDVNGEVENECEATHENVLEIQREKGRLHPLSHRVNTKALEATKMVPKEEDNKKVIVVALIEEKTGAQEKEEDKTDLAEKSDSCAVVLVEANKEEDKKEESHGYSSSSEVKNGNSIASLVDDVEENNQEVEILCFSSSTQVEVSNIEVENGDSTVALVEGDKKNDEELEIQVSSFTIETQDSNVKTESEVFNLIHVEEKGRNDQEESHELSSFCVQNSIGHGYSSSSEVKNGDSIAPLVEEVKENNKEVENLCFSSSTQVEDSNVEIETGDSTVALVEGDEKNVEELEIQVSSFSIEMQDSNVETESEVFNVVHVEEKGRNDQEESHELSSFFVENSVEHCNNQSPENDLVFDSSNIVPTHEAVEDSVDNSSNAKLASSALSDSLLCSEATPFPHEEAIQQSFGFEEEARKLSLHFTEMTLKEAKLIFSENLDAGTNLGDEASTTEASGGIPGKVLESGGVLPSEISVANGETIDGDLSNAGELSVIDSVNTQGTSFESRILVSSIELCTEISASDSTIEWPDKNANELPVVIKESFEDSITDSSELTANGFVDVWQKEETLKDYFFELQIPVSSAELCSEFLTVDSTIESHAIDHLSENHGESVEDDNLHKLPANESFDVSQKTEIYQSDSFKLQNPVSCAKLCFELSTVNSDIDFNESFGNVSSEISALLDESVAAGLPNSAEISSEKSVDAETSQDASFEPQIPVPSPAELCVQFPSTSLATIDFKESFGNVSSEISALLDESVAAGLPNSAEISSEKSEDAETSQDASFEPQIPVPSPAELCVEFSSTSLATICSPLKLPCASETRPLLQPSIVQTQPSEQAPIATTEMAEENGETVIKASGKEVFLKGENFELMSLTKLRAMYKQMVNGPKTEVVEKRKSIIKREDIQCLSGIKDDENNKQKLNDDITKSEKKRSAIKQQDLECLSRSKLDSNFKQKLTDEFIKSERKRTPLKNLNYKIEF